MPQKPEISGHLARMQTSLYYWKKDAKPLSGLERDSNPQPLCNRCNAFPTELLSGMRAFVCGLALNVYRT